MNKALEKTLVQLSQDQLIHVIEKAHGSNKICQTIIEQSIAAYNCISSLIKPLRALKTAPALLITVNPMSLPRSWITSMKALKSWSPKRLI